MKKTAIRRVAVILLVLVLIWAIQRCLDRPREEEAVYTHPRQIRYSFTLKNTTNELIQDAKLWVYAPVKQTPTQYCHSIKASHDYELRLDSLGNQILYFSFKAVPPYSSRIIRIQADLLLSETPNRIPAMAPVTDFLKPEPYVASGHPDIIARAKQLLKPDPLTTAAAISQWVSGHMSYSGYQRHERGALYALQQAEGDCTEYMNLFAALCRAVDIPCQRLGGYICPENMVLNASGYHNWAEFFHEGKWYIADPQKGLIIKKGQDEKGQDYIAMRVISAWHRNDMKNHDRFRVEGQGMVVKMN